MGAVQAHAVEALRAGRAPENAGGAYLANLRIVEAIYASAETGERVGLAAEGAAAC